MMNIIEYIKDYFFVFEMFVSLLIELISTFFLILILHVKNLFLTVVFSIAMLVIFFVVRKNYLSEKLNEILSGAFFNNSSWTPGDFFRICLFNFIVFFVILLYSIFTLYHMPIDNFFMLVGITLGCLILVGIILVARPWKNVYRAPAISYLLYELSLITVYSLFVSAVILSFVGLVDLNIQEVQWFYRLLVKTCGKEILMLFMTGVSFALAVYFSLQITFLIYERLFRKMSVFTLVCVFIFAVFCTALILGFLYMGTLVSYQVLFTIIFPQEIFVYQIFYLTYPVWKNFIRRIEVTRETF